MHIIQIVAKTMEETWKGFLFSLTMCIVLPSGKSRLQIHIENIEPLLIFTITQNIYHIMSHTSVYKCVYVDGVCVYKIMCNR